METLKFKLNEFATNPVMSFLLTVLKYLGNILDNMWFMLKVGYSVHGPIDEPHLIKEVEHNKQRVFSAVHEDGWPVGSLSRTVWRNKYTGKIERVDEWRT